MLAVEGAIRGLKLFVIAEGGLAQPSSNKAALASGPQVFSWGVC